MRWPPKEVPLVRDRLERLLHAVPRGGDWLGAVAGVAEDDLADERGLDDLVGRGGEGAEELLRESRVPRVRPILVVLAARASGSAEVDHELQYAAELLHAALSLHDLALGRRGNRRRRIARGVLKGVEWVGANRVTLRAMELVRHGSDGEALDALIDTLGAFHDAQELAAGLLDEGAPSGAIWEEHADGHMGALFAFCCRAGASLSVAGPGELSAFARFGRHLGRMWHIAEDVVLLQEVDGAEHLIGRALVGRPMLPVAVAIERAPELGAAWRRLVEGPDRYEAEAFLERMRDVSAFHGTREVMAREHWSARQALARFEATPHRAALERLASGLSRAPYENMAAPEGEVMLDQDD